MGIGKETDFQVYSEQFFGGMVEVLEQNANAFNAASQNTILLVPRRIKGHFEQESFIKTIAGLVGRRDTTSTAAVTDKAMQQGEFAGVKVNRRIGPVANTLDSFKKIAKDPQTMSFLLGQQIGSAVAVDYINTALLAIVAALSGVAALNYDGTGDSPATCTHAKLVKGMAKMGDAAGRIKAWVMHSKTYFDLMQQAIADKVFEVAGVVIMSGNVATFNKPTIVLDSPSLITSGSPDAYSILGLVENAAECAESEERNIVSDLITGLENLVLRIQGEYAFNLKMKGFAWDITNGGKNPTDAALATSTNWDNQMADIKSLGGVRIKVN